MPLAQSVTRSNVPQNVLLRWNVERAGIEFGVTTVMLNRALAQISATPGNDGCYTTQQICEALFGDMHKEKIATQRQITERITLENEITRGEVLNRAELSRVFTMIAEAMSSRIMSYDALPRAAREDILKDLSSWPLGLEEVAHRQTRLPRGRGKRHDEDQSELAS
jgi:hypothetical protein